MGETTRWLQLQLQRSCSFPQCNMLHHVSFKSGYERFDLYLIILINNMTVRIIPFTAKRVSASLLNRFYECNTCRNTYFYTNEFLHKIISENGHVWVYVSFHTYILNLNAYGAVWFLPALWFSFRFFLPVNLLRRLRTSNTNSAAIKTPKTRTNPNTAYNACVNCPMRSATERNIFCCYKLIDTHKSNYVVY